MTFGDSRPKIGLALSGGTLKAAAHIGVIQQLTEMGIRPDMVAGTSAGALIASLHAHGYSPAAMIQLANRFSLWSLVDYGFPLISSAMNVLRYRLGWPARPRRLVAAQGLLAGRKLERYVAAALRRRTARIPYYLIATDLSTGLPVTFSNDAQAIQRGIARPCPQLAKAVTASCSLPGMFSPVAIDDLVLVDGALRHYVPVQILKDCGCTKIIAVNLYQLDDGWVPETMVHVLIRSFEILLQESIDNDVHTSDVVLLEPNLHNMSWFSVGELPQCIAAGRAVVQAHEAMLEALIRT